MEGNIVIDLDETLLHTYTDRAKFEAFQPKYGEEKFDLGRFYGVLRPNVKSFIGWCSGNFKEIGVWSAGQQEYVDEIVDLLFKGRKPTFVWCWDDCDSYTNEDGRAVYHKPLEFVFDLIPGFTPKNTLFIDDSAHSDICNAGNMITITPFNPEDAPQVPDNSMAELKRVIKKYKKVKDVRLVEKKII